MTAPSAKASTSGHCRFWAVVLASLAPWPAWAVDYDGPRIDTVDVAGDLSQVRRQMRHVGHEGHYAWTHWDVRYHFTSRPGRDGCVVATVKVVLTTTITMPHLRAEASTAEVRRHWKTFEPALRTHEMGHADLALSGARAMESALWHVPAQPRCAEIDRLAKEKADAILDEMHHHDLDYDARTRHGRTQGAVF